MRWNRLVVAGTAAVALGGAAWADDALTLGEALRLAAEGPAVQATAAQVDAAAARVAEARAARLPHLEVGAEAQALRDDPGLRVPVGAFGNPVPLAFVTGERATERVGVEARQLLLDFGRTGAAMRAAEAGRDAATDDVASRRREIGLATARAYAGAVAAEARVGVLRQAERSADETVRVVSALVEQGLAARSDRLAAEFHREDVRARAAEAEADAGAARAALTALVGVTPGTLELPAAPAPEDEAHAAARATASRPEVRALQRQRAALEARATSERARRLPLVVLQAAAEKTWDAYLLHQTNAAAAVGVRWSAFDGGEAGARAAGLEAQARALERAEQALRLQVTAEVTAAQAAERAMRARVDAGERAVAAAAEALRLERLRHEQGLATTRELLQAMTDDTAARGGLAAARAGLVAAVAQRVAATGDDLRQAFPENER